MREILGSQQALEGLERIAGEMMARSEGGKNLALVGIRKGGVPMAEHLAKLIMDRTGHQVPMGSVDITLYRDDGPEPLPMPHIGRSDVVHDDRITLSLRRRSAPIERKGGAVAVTGVFNGKPAVCGQVGTAEGEARGICLLHRLAYLDNGSLFSRWNIQRRFCRRCGRSATSGKHHA